MAGDGFDSDCSQTMIGFVQSSSSTMKEHTVQCYHGTMVQPAHSKMLTDDLKQTLYQVESQQPQSAAEMTQDIKNTDDAMAESAASSMNGFEHSLFDGLNAEDTLIQISDEPQDQTNIFLYEKYMLPSKSKRAVSEHRSFEPRDETDLLI